MQKNYSLGNFFELFSKKRLAQFPSIWFNKYCCRVRQRRVADLAQLAEHLTSNEEVGGSNPLVSITNVLDMV